MGSYAEALRKQQQARGLIPKDTPWQPVSPLSGKVLWGDPSLYGDQIVFLKPAMIPNHLEYQVVAMHSNGTTSGDAYGAIFALIPEMGTAQYANDG